VVIHTKLPISGGRLGIHCEHFLLFTATQLTIYAPLKKTCQRPVKNFCFKKKQFSN